MNVMTTYSYCIICYLNLKLILFVSSVAFYENVSMHIVTNVTVLNFPFNHTKVAFLLSVIDQRVASL